MQLYTVIEPVVNLRRKPIELPPCYDRDDQLETQLLYNEMVHVKKAEGAWCFVEAIEQSVFRKMNMWQGYPGWVPRKSIRPADENQGDAHAIVKVKIASVLKDSTPSGNILFSISLGTKVTIREHMPFSKGFIPIETGHGRYGWIDKNHLFIPGNAPSRGGINKEIIATAHLFCGIPYVWGGRSMHMPHLNTIATGVDCSGLINLAFRTHGIDIPRDAHEQWMKAEPISHDALEPGDLIFIAPETKGIISHVMLFTGGETFIEAPETGGMVRTCTFIEKLGVELAVLKEQGLVVNNHTISFGRISSCQ